MVVDTGHTSWLRALACASKPELRFAGDLMLRVLEIDKHLEGVVPTTLPFGEQVTYDIVIRPFFDRLFEMLLERLTEYQPGLKIKKWALVGNPGIGKS